MLETEEGCWQTDQMERYGNNHVSSVSTPVFSHNNLGEKIIQSKE